MDIEEVLVEKTFLFALQHNIKKQTPFLKLKFSSKPDMLFSICKILNLDPKFISEFCYQETKGDKSSCKFFFSFLI